MFECPGCKVTFHSSRALSVHLSHNDECKESMVNCFFSNKSAMDSICFEASSDTLVNSDNNDYDIANENNIEHAIIDCQYSKSIELALLNRHQEH
jgi:hypothetical protein